MIVNIHVPCLEAMAMKIIDSIALFGTYCLFNKVHRSYRYEVCIEIKQLIYVANARVVSKHNFKLTVTDNMEIRYESANVTIFCV